MLTMPEQSCWSARPTLVDLGVLIWSFLLQERLPHVRGRAAAAGQEFPALRV